MNRTNDESQGSLFRAAGILDLTAGYVIFPILFDQLFSAGPWRNRGELPAHHFYMPLARSGSHPILIHAPIPRDRLFLLCEYAKKAFCCAYNSAQCSVNNFNRVHNGFHLSFPEIFCDDSGRHFLKRGFVVSAIYAPLKGLWTSKELKCLMLLQTIKSNVTIKPCL
jgi:hypothetical protein